MQIEVAQSEIRRSYLRGGPGAIVSGIVWLASGVTATVSNVRVGFAVLFFGGMLIFPIATFIVRTLLRRKPVSRTNPGGLTVIETTFPMIAGFMAAWLLLPYRPDFAFPMSAIAVGAHYFGFRTAYGDWTNWILAGLMCSVGVSAIFSGLPSAIAVPFVIAAVEVSFGVWFIWMSLLNETQDIAAAHDQDAGGD
jgi:hypothetical protein